MKKRMSFFSILIILIILPLFTTSCAELAIFAGEVVLESIISPSDPCKGKNTHWDPGKKKYCCYDDKGEEICK
jgi:hypothetical protein